MKVNAEEFNKKPSKVYRAADKGETVTINHGQYEDKVFELTARDREPLKESVIKDFAGAVANELGMTNEQKLRLQADAKFIDKGIKQEVLYTLGESTIEVDFVKSETSKDHPFAKTKEEDK